MKKLCILLTMVIGLGAFSVSVYASENVVLSKEATERLLKEDIQENLDILNDSIKAELSKINMIEPEYKEFEVELNDGHISTVEIEIIETPMNLPIPRGVDVDDVENYKSYIARTTVRSPFGSDYRGGSLEQKIYYSTLGNNEYGITRLSFDDTTMDATPPQACSVTDLDSRLTAEQDTSLTCDGFVTIEVSGPWSVFITIYTEMMLDAGENKVVLVSDYSL